LTLEVVMTNPRATSALVAALFLALFSLAACSSDDAADASKKTAQAGGGENVYAEGGFDSVTDPSPAKRAAPQSTGPAIEVTWEALAHERYLQENSRYRRRGPLPPQKIVLLSASHPRARAVQSGRGGEKGAQTAVLSDRDMQGLVKGLEERGFFRHARTAGFDAAIVKSANARGRVTVTRGSDSRTLVSLRGQGRNPATKDIPRIYSEAKQAIMVLRNMHPTLSVSSSGASGNASVR